MLLVRPVSRRLLALLALQAAMLPRRALSGEDVFGDRAVFAAPDGGASTVTAQIFIPYEAETPGLAHYAEHLAMLSVLGKAPGELDPHGSASVTGTVMVYWLSGPPGKLAGILKTLAGVFAPLDLPQAFADTERDVIQREYDLAVLDNPDRLALEAVDAFLYAGNSLAVSVLGTREQIAAITYEQAKAFHATTHRPENAILVVTGDVSDKALQEAISASGFPAMALRSAIRPASFRFPGAAEKVFAYPLSTAMPRMVWRKVVKLPEAVQFDALVQRCNLLFDVLISALPGGLPKQLRFDAFIAQSVDLAIFPLDESHAEIRLWLQPDTGVSFARLRSALEAALAQTAAGIPQPTFERVLRRFLEQTPQEGDERASAENLIDRVASRRFPLGTQRLRALAQQLNQADTERLLSAIAGPGRLAVAFIGQRPPKRLEVTAEDAALMVALNAADGPLLETVRTRLRAAYRFNAIYDEFGAANGFLLFWGEVETGKLADAETAIRQGYAAFRERGPNGSFDARKARLAAELTDTMKHPADASWIMLRGVLLETGLPPLPGQQIAAMTQETLMARLEQFPAAEAFTVIAVSPDAAALPGACVITAPEQAEDCR